MKRYLVEVNEFINEGDGNYDLMWQSYSGIEHYDRRRARNELIQAERSGLYYGGRIVVLVDEEDEDEQI